MSINVRRELYAKAPDESTAEGRSQRYGRGTGLQRVAGPQLHQGLVRADNALDQHLHAAAGGLARRHPGGNHPGVVEDQKIACMQEVRQFSEHPVIGTRTGDVQQSAARTSRGRDLRDQFRWKLECEIGKGVGRHGHQREPTPPAAAVSECDAALAGAVRGPFSLEPRHAAGELARHPSR